jgi:hypothetical protein
MNEYSNDGAHMNHFCSRLISELVSEVGQIMTLLT